jgi:hypothetical protein
MDDDKTQQNNKDVKVLRTYTSDMADVIRENEVSVIKIAMAEKEKQDREVEYKKAKGTNLSKILLLIGGVVLIVVAIFVASYIIQKKKVVPIPPPNKIETFLPYDSEMDIDVTKVTNINNLSNTIKDGEQTQPGMIEAFFLMKKVNDTYVTFTSKDFLSLIQTTMPGALIRSLTDKYLVGKYSNKNVPGSGSGMFLILETTDYNLAYASMLEWEGTLLEDLFVLFNLPKPENALSIKPWNDMIVNNKDTRVLYGENGQPIIYYSFVNKKNFIITDNIEALKEVISRIFIKNPQ